MFIDICSQYEEVNMMKIKIGGMSCNHCVQAVTKAIAALPGVTEVKVDLQSGEADIEASGVSLASIQAAVEKAGYEVL
jgi:copper chaperone